MGFLVFIALKSALLGAEPVTVEIIDEQVLMCEGQCCVIKELEIGEPKIWKAFQDKCLVKENSVK